MKVAYIMRGVPGSGKSTIARQLAGENGVIHSTDNYFMVDGEYRIDPKKLREHHDANHKAFCDSITAGFEIVICDNTNTQPWHFKRYVEFAEKAGYLVAFVTIPHPDPVVAAERNTHKVPEYAIRKMIQEWKD